MNDKQRNSENVIKYVFPIYTINIFASLYVEGKGWKRKGIKILLALLRSYTTHSL